MMQNDAFSGSRLKYIPDLKGQVNGLSFPRKRESTQLDPCLRGNDKIGKLLQTRSREQSASLNGEAVVAVRSPARTALGFDVEVAAVAFAEPEESVA